MEVKERKPFNKRAFISVALVIAGLGLPFSGIMNHELQFSPFTPERHFWMSVHNMSAFLFTIFAVVHISYNRRSLMHYVKKVKSIRISREAIYAVVFIAGLVVLFSLHALHVR